MGYKTVSSKFLRPGMIGLLFLVGCPNDPDDNNNDIQDDDTYGIVGVKSTSPDDKSASDAINLTLFADFDYTVYHNCNFHVIPFDTCEIVHPPGPECIQEITWFDAGIQGTFDVNGQQGVLNRKTPADGPGFAGIHYYPDPTSVSAFVDNLLNFQFFGGEDIGPFSGLIKTMMPPKVFAPILTRQSYGWNVSLDFNNDLPVQWDTDHPGQEISISIYVTKEDLNTETCNCRVHDDGNFTVPAQYLRALADGGFNDYGIIIERQTYDVIDVQFISGEKIPILLYSTGEIKARSALKEHT